MGVEAGLDGLASGMDAIQLFVLAETQLVQTKNDHRQHCHTELGSG